MELMFFVPEGYGKLNKSRLPDIQTTKDPEKILTADFKNGKEIW